MAEPVLDRRIMTILGQADPEKGTFYTAEFQAEDESSSCSKPVCAANCGYPIWNFGCEFADEIVDLLRALYETLPRLGPEREELVRFITASVMPDSPQRPYLSRVLLFLAKTRGAAVAAKMLSSACTADVASARAVAALSDFICFEHSVIPEGELDPILESLETVVATQGWNHLPKDDDDIVGYPAGWIEERVALISKQIERLKYERLKHELLEGANFEVNRDRENLLGEIESLGFSKEVAEFLEYAEQEYRKADSEFQFKSSIDNTRSFFAELLGEIASSVATKLGENLRNRKREPRVVDVKAPQTVRTYLKQTGVLSESLANLVAQFYHVMSDEGTHSLSADKNLARISRNIAVELGLLLTSRLREFLSKKS